MKEVFNRVIPEIAHIVNVQSCTLFSVSPDRENVVLEAGYPDTPGYHGIGKSFPVKSERAFELVLGAEVPADPSPYEVVTQTYVLVIDPQRSEKISHNLKDFAVDHNVNSILYVPLNVGEEITHFMTFDALDLRRGYSEWEIEIFLFLGRELMQAQRLEQLDDTLHDFKNPAIAIAGFARRLNTLLHTGSPLERRGDDQKVSADPVEETSRMQEMALSIHHAGQEQVVDLTEILKKRFDNQEAIKEMLKANIWDRTLSCVAAGALLSHPIGTHSGQPAEQCHQGHSAQGGQSHRTDLRRRPLGLCRDHQQRPNRG